ncbi:MAG: hypothetical protein COT39_02780 [Parcubacteria group bacterium CG08_land_8_20_14_0_20_48_21]|nr:MAG: hypothetical protein AUK21_02900 [Parcubacteria group bacterium CG2_30_48_51]PIS32757.1 MAG: hypothetical protein COT39_02780 [Parcubacteria group bacterium CG08_land_8_20_14_0_20_48_21]PIW79130.1 MAG: hypothetical protein COZ99_02495 [Parcubacteria group bacterium CG_4_8_14_3_um_filter_48_16]PIY77778.1 MAG: hypothetical protein COY83_03160 [Parcubacteria group bacterium CG_4_10_14_0_8_um_filter_48_154]PIZ78008.1 MAG: hypothetical protein COY03_00950 [bacterium CG_4_10_14_0_2_um_filter_
MCSTSAFRLTAALLLLMELVSFFSYLIPVFGAIAYGIVLLTILGGTLWRLEIGLYAAFAELMVGSKGYLLVLPLGGVNLSLRMGIYLIVMAVWFGHFLLYREQRIRLMRFFATPLGKAYGFFAVVIGMGIARGILLRHAFADIFFDVNSYAYGTLLLPLLAVYIRHNFFARLIEVACAATVILSLKTLWLVLWFSHPLWYWWEPVYRWVRMTGVGEITQLLGGMSRIFLQSQIFHLVGLFIVLALLLHRRESQKTLTLWLLASLFTASLFASGSRSFWVGSIAGLFFIFLLPLFPNIRHRKTYVVQAVKFFSVSMVAGVLGVFLAWSVAVVPLPKLGSGSFDLSVLAQRAATFSGEAGVGSRWALLKPLLGEIKKAPIRGQGFGATVTYISQDPRILATHPDGLYTTSAVEWGYLDMWLKMGLIGILALLWLLWTLGREWTSCLRTPPPPFYHTRADARLFGFGIGMIALATTHAFSPYLNHPLGIGLLLLFTVALLTKSRQQISGIRA